MPDISCVCDGDPRADEAQSIQWIDALVSRQAWGEAEAAARDMVRRAPDAVQGHGVLGLIFSIRERLPEGEFHLRRALALHGGRPPRLLMQLAMNLETQGRLDDARELYEAAAAAEPTAREATFALARLDGLKGDADGMTSRLAALAPAALSSPVIIRLQARAAYDRKDFQQVLNLLQPGGALVAVEASDLYLIGQALDKLGRHGEAFAAFAKANATHRNSAGGGFDLNGPKALAEGVLMFVTPTFRTLPRAPKAPGAQPLFIVGFARSGTTMLEQSLSMHSKITAAGELSCLSTVAYATTRLLDSTKPYPFSLGELWMGDQHDQIGLLRDNYLNSVRRSAPDGGGGWFTDKALTHELHLGLMHLLFPQSPIIHILRHPLDVVISGFANGLPHGGYAGGVREIAEYYKVLFDAARHWQDSIPDLKRLQVRYEDILDDQEGEIRRILDFVGEPYDPACLRFHENGRFARTLSHRQVREPISDTSKYRYKRHLERLGPAIEVLGPTIEALGYRV
jgi:tetratricopeptide (TPR) repeat protein